MKFFRDKLYEDITIPAPPKDDIGEAAEVKRLIANRTAEQEKSIADHDEVPFYAIKKYCDDNKMMFHKDEFKDIIYGLFKMRENGCFFNSFMILWFF